MDEIHVHRRLLKWGNAYGLRVTRAEVRRLGVREKDTVAAEIRAEKTRLDPDRLHLVDIGADASRRHRDLAREASDARH